MACSHAPLTLFFEGCTMATKMKEAKADPWAVLSGKATASEAPDVGNNWNTSKDRKADDVLMGTVGKTEDTVTSYGPGKILSIKSKSGPVETVFLSKVLQGAIDKAGGFSEGDRVFIKFHGTPAGKRYKNYSVGKA